MASESGHGVTVFCLPYAGGSAAIYRDWPARVPSWLKLVALHLPGRGIRHAVRPIHRWPPLLDLLIEDVRPHLGRPFAIFGHSMGALIGIELAHAIRERFGVSPVWVGASACKAPSRREQQLHWLTCGESEFIDEIRSLGGMPDELLGNREFMELVLPTLRADFHLCGSYEHDASRRPLDCPLLAIGGTEDREIAAHPPHLAAWSAESAGPFELKQIHAGHFFINTHRDEVIGLMVDSLARALSSRGPSGESLLQRSPA